MKIFLKFFLHLWCLKTSNICLWKKVVYLICLSHWNLPILVEVEQVSYEKSTWKSRFATKFVEKLLFAKDP
jgi:hypothetical protein